MIANTLVSTGTTALGYSYRDYGALWTDNAADGERIEHGGHGQPARKPALWRRFRSRHGRRPWQHRAHPRVGFASNQREDSNMPIRSTQHFQTVSLALAAIMTLGLSGPALASPAEATTTPPAASTQQPAAEPFTAVRFAALQADNALILVDVAATWCPTCKAQKAVIDAFRQQYPELGLHVLTVDFDTQKEWVKHFKAPRQSTLLVYKGSEQRWFAVAETREDVITAALRQAASSR